MKFRNSLFVLASLLLFTVQCEIIGDDKLESPNSLPPSAVDPDFLLNQIQLEARGIYRGAASIGGEMTRMTYMFGDTYANAFSPNSFNGIYGNAYNDQFKDTDNLLPIAEERGFTIHAGMAKILKGYSLLVLVDMFGDMPYSEALDATNFNPSLDSGESIYAEAIALLDAGIADIDAGIADGAPIPDNDFYYGDESTANQLAYWKRAANTFKLKAYLNTGNSAGATALVADADNSLIIDEDQDFDFKYTLNEVDPDSRHPNYASNYVDNTGAGAYMAVSFMNMLLTDKDDMDPRMRYYFYRQTTSDTEDVNENTCITSFAPPHFDADDPYCLLGDGWWGRDHLIDDGIPPDGELRTTWGVYPVGGLFDGSTGGSADRGDGLGGAGFEPIMLSFYTQFMIAEVELTMNNDAVAAKAALDLAMEGSFDKVAEFGEDLAEATPFAITADDVTDYIAEVTTRWDAANDSNKLRQIIREYYFAVFPNGYEAYNAMRRTGYPDRADNLQPARSPNPGNWYRSVLYPANMTERNSNVEQKSNSDILQGPFWDPDKGSTKFNF